MRKEKETLKLSHKNDLVLRKSPHRKSSADGALPPIRTHKERFETNQK